MDRKKASDYPQELLDLFHQYVHGDISRRGFLEGAGKFAVGGLTAAAIFESLKPNYAWAQQVQKDDKRIKTIGLGKTKKVAESSKLLILVYPPAASAQRSSPSGQ